MTVVLLQDCIGRSTKPHMNRAGFLFFWKIQLGFYFFCSRPIIWPDSITVSRE